MVFYPLNENNMNYDSYYAMTSSKRNGTTIEEEMKKRGYVKDYYIGSGAYHWKKENQKG